MKGRNEAAQMTWLVKSRLVGHCEGVKGVAKFTVAERSEICCPALKFERLAVS